MYKTTSNSIKRVLATTIIVLATLSATADNSRVSLLTCSPGEEVYELFGHTALRYTDSSKHTDVVFGYGYFSFNTPNFVWRFILGETDYLVGCVDYEDFIEEYRYRGAGVTEQVIHLDSLQKRALFDALWLNCHPSNRVYRYNYFYNNCTTKVRDKLYEQLGDSITHTRATQQTTLRKAVETCTAAQPWTSFGVNLLLGADIDRPATQQELQFLPANLMNDLAAAQTTTGENIVEEQTELLQPTNKEKSINHFTPFNSAILLLLFTMIIMLCEVRSHKIFWAYDILLYSLQGFAGLLLLFMALFSQHPAVGNNYLLMWINPIPLALIPFIVYCAKKDKNMNFMWVEIAMVAAFIVTAPFVPQSYPTPAYILAITIFVRSLFHIHRKKICELSLY